MGTDDIIKIFPLLFLILSGLVLMIMDAFKSRQLMPAVTAIGFLGSMVLAGAALAGNEPRVSFAFSDMVATGGLANIVSIILCFSGLITLFFLQDFLKRQEKPVFEIYPILVFAVVGMLILANANDLILTFIGLETMSICLYIMAALYKMDLRSNEAGLKYFLLGAFASGIFIYGIALVYGAAGTTNFSVMAKSLAETGKFENAAQLGSLVTPGVALILIGFLFKVSAFPFHAWTPDVYSGTPTPLTGFMATGSKAAAFIAFGIFLNTVLPGIDATKFYWVIASLALATMIYGNVVAVQQKDLKRMLAYSSIAHSGYVLLGLCAGKAGLMAAIFYLFIYTIMNVGAFGLIAMAEDKDETLEMDKLKGFGFKYPWLGAALAIFMFSMAGVPPLAGFMGKYFVFMAVIKSNMVWFAILGIMTSVVGAYYYIRVIITMYSEKTNSTINLENRPFAPSLGIGVLASLLVILGVYAYLMIVYLDRFTPGYLY